MFTGHRFNLPLEGVFPPKLDCLVLGSGYDQPLAAVTLPGTLNSVKLGHFNHSITDVVWTAGLTSIDFGYAFNQPIRGVVFPACLREMRLGRRFAQASETMLLRQSGRSPYES